MELGEADRHSLDELLKLPGLGVLPDRRCLRSQTPSGEVGATSWAKDELTLMDRVGEESCRRASRAVWKSRGRIVVSDPTGETADRGSQGGRRRSEDVAVFW